MKKESGKIIYSPSDLIRFLASPFASWLDRYNFENPGAIKPDGYFTSFNFIEPVS